MKVLSSLSLIVWMVILVGCGPSDGTVSAPPEVIPDTTEVDAARQKADKAYSGEYKDVPGEEALHQPN